MGLSSLSPEFNEPQEYTTSLDQCIAIGVVGIGKIARDQHLPALARIPAVRLVATASRHGSVDGVTSFPDIERMIAETPKLDAVSLCAPATVRAAMARAAIAAGLAVMLEKPRVLAFPRSLIWWRAQNVRA